MAGDPSPAVVFAADERFALPLAVTVRSLLDNLGAGRALRVYVLDGGIRPGTKERLLSSWPVAWRSCVEWLCPDPGSLQGLLAWGHVNLMTYYRLLIPRVLPAALERVIYLDADLLVRRDIGQLWEQDMGGRWCLAAQDCATPYIDSSEVLANFQKCGPLLAATRPIANYRELGLRPEMPYFNAGVLVLDLAAWRSADLSGRLLECLRANQAHVLWWDQYALNVVLAGRWAQLDPRWNQGSHLYEFPTWAHSPVDRETYERLRADPFIVHFSSPLKPWHAHCRHPFREEFFHYLDRTAWAGWRPSAREFLARWPATRWLRARRQCGNVLRRSAVLFRSLLRPARGPGGRPDV